MDQVRVTSQGPHEFVVEVTDGSSSSTHRVSVSDDALERFGAGASAERLVEESFRFLLEREPKESIMSSFELPVIARYFPEYPEEIRFRLSE